MWPRSMQQTADNLENLPAVEGTWIRISARTAPHCLPDPAMLPENLDETRKKLYSSPWDLRPLHLTIQSIVRPAISDTSLIFSK